MWTFAFTKWCGNGSIADTQEKEAHGARKNIFDAISLGIGFFLRRYQKRTVQQLTSTYLKQVL